MTRMAWGLSVLGRMQVRCLSHPMTIRTNVPRLERTIPPPNRSTLLSPPLNPPPPDAHRPYANCFPGSLLVRSTISARARCPAAMSASSSSSESVSSDIEERSGGLYEMVVSERTLVGNEEAARREVSVVTEEGSII